MSDFDPAIVGKQGCSDNGCGITYDKHPIWLKVCQNRIEMCKDRGTDLCQRLISTHQVQVIIWLDLEKCKHLIEHLPVLRRDTDTRFNIWCFLESSYNRRDLDGFGAGAENREDFDGHDENNTIVAYRFTPRRN